MRARRAKDAQMLDDATATLVAAEDENRRLAATLAQMRLEAMQLRALHEFNGAVPARDYDHD